jgi:phosphoglycolate phosphatase
MIKTLAVFDVDGTLVDSRVAIFESAKAVYARMGLPEPAYDDVRKIVGLGLREAFHVLLPLLSEPELDRALDAYRDSFAASRSQPGHVEPLYAGAAETLARLKRDGWRIAMATGKSRRGVEAVIRMHGWAGLFETTHCSEDGPGKPHPAMLLAAMRALDCRPQETIMIGDTAHDMRMAKAAGVYAQGVSWGFHTAAEVAEGGADHVAHDFASLNHELDAFARRVAALA